MTPTEERLEILEMIQRGTISSEEGLKLIEALGENWDAEGIPGFSDQDDTLASLEPVPENDVEDFSKWRAWWVIPFWIGVGISTLGGALMYWGWSAHGLGLGFFLAWIPFMIGIGTMVLGWNSKSGPWIHVRIHQAPGEHPQRINISLPLPIRLLSWTIRNFGSYIKGLESTGLDEVILALEQTSPDDVPLSINVTDDDDGSQVKVYIG
jgi:hypothetical protein